MGFFMVEKTDAKKSKYIVVFQICVIATTVLGGNATYYTLSKLIMFLFFGVVLIDMFHNRFKISVGVLFEISVTFVVLEFLSLIWSHNTNLADSQFMTQIQLFALYFFVYQVISKHGEIEDYIIAIYLSGLCMIVFAMLQYGGISNYLNIMETGSRLGGEITNENAFGMVFGNSALCAMYYAILKRKKIHFLSLIPLVFFGFSSGSKKVVFIICAGFLGLCLIKYGVKRIYKLFLAIVIFIIAIKYVLSLPIFETVNDRLMSYLSGNTNTSDNARNNMIQFGLELFGNRPILGYGLQNFRNFYHSGQYSHNNFVELLVSVGLIGFIIYYLMYLIPVIKIVKNWILKGVADNQMLMLLLMLIVSLIFGWGMVQFYEKSTWILLAVAHAFIDRLMLQEKVKDKVKMNYV